MTEPTAELEKSLDSPRRMVMGSGSGMMARHHAQIPDEYAGLTDLMPADEVIGARGRDLWPVLHLLPRRQWDGRRSRRPIKEPLPNNPDER